MVTKAQNGNGAAVHEEVATRVVALVGTATSSRDLVNDQGPEVEVWGLNKSYDWMPRWDRWFEVHSRERYKHIEGDHLKKLQEMTCPIYMAEPYEDIPQAVQFPIVHVLQGRYRPLFTSTISYMLGLAIAEGFTEIRLCGIDMKMDSEYAFQRSACEYWIGIAEALGIKVVIPDSSPIGKAPLYGVEPPDRERMFRDWRDKFDQERLGKYENYFTKLIGEVDTFRIELAAVEGARQAAALMSQGEI